MWGCRWALRDAGRSGSSGTVGLGASGCVVGVQPYGRVLLRGCRQRSGVRRGAVGLEHVQGSEVTWGGGERGCGGRSEPR